MRSWSSPPVPVVGGEAPPLRFFDSATRALVTSAPSEVARLYVCGITPYDATHLGHAATYLTFDLLQRQWRDRGVRVEYAQNVTDVDDPLLERAAATGVDWRDLATREIDLYRDDMAALRILPPDDYVGVVESIDLVVDLIERLGDAVYRVDDDLYFDVHAARSFGSVAGLSEAEMLVLSAERGGDPERPGKRDPLDCLLWQAPRPGEPSWPSRLGPGRPGWHVECTAIALAHLGPGFDVQGGGRDLVFPHHEMCAAQALVDTGAPFAGAYVHVGLVGYEGEKMSKSLGNLVLVSTLRDQGRDPMAIRLALLGHHHRDEWEWFDTDLTEAEKRLSAWRDAVARPTAAPASSLLAAVRAAMANDLDAPTALEAIDAWASTSGDDPDSPATVAAAVDALLGVLL